MAETPPADQQEPAPQQQQQQQQQGVPMIPPQFLPEIVHYIAWPDPNGDGGVCLLISSPAGQQYHFWPHDMALEAASKIKKIALGSGLIEVRNQLVIPGGVNLAPPAK